MSGVGAVAYLVAGVFFIRSLGGLSAQETALKGNRFGVFGMLLAVAVTGGVWFASTGVAAPVGLALLGGALLIGTLIGSTLARRVEMTGMPELVAILHSFVGLAALLVSIATYLTPTEHHDAVSRNIHLVEIWVGAMVGAITFTGSVIAWAKLRGTMSGKPTLLPGRHALNAISALVMIAMAAPFLMADDPSGWPWLIAMSGLACVVGAHLVMAIGGADMPVVVSLLNSYSGWAASAAGFVLGNDLLIVTGALVGSSGAILSVIMCRAMNRSIWNVVFGGFGTAESTAVSAPSGGEVREVSIPETAALLTSAKRVVVVPGYGMAVARAQASVRELMEVLREKRVDLRFAIHPVAGRLPGHMNVLLAEAGVPYQSVVEMEDINHDFPTTDVVLVIGANDIVNPAALDDASSPIYGMPVLEVWKAKKVIVLKRGMAAGYAGIDNPLFFHVNAAMLFGDARKSIESLVGAARA